MKKPNKTHKRLIKGLIAFPDFDGLVSLACVLRYRLSANDILACMVNGGHKEIDSISADALKWVDLGISDHQIKTIILGLINYGAGHAAVEMTLALNRPHIDRYILTKDLQDYDQLGDMMPLVLQTSDIPMLESFLCSCVRKGDASVAADVAKKIGRPLKKSELETMLKVNLGIGMVGDVAAILKLLGRKLTSKQGDALISCLLNSMSDPANAAVASYCAGRPLTIPEVAKIMARIKK